MTAWRDLPVGEGLRRRYAYEEDVKGPSALVTGIPGRHARRRMGAVAVEERLHQAVRTRLSITPNEWHDLLHARL
jgi:hypothetical protein